MSTIFVGGSRHIATIPADVARRIETIMERRHDVIVAMLQARTRPCSAT